MLQFDLGDLHEHSSVRRSGGTCDWCSLACGDGLHSPLRLRAASFQGVADQYKPSASASFRQSSFPHCEINSATAIWLALLHQLRAAMLDLKRYAYSSLVDVARWSEVPAGTPLFDHILVFDNSSLDRLAARYGNLELGRLTIEQHSSYPLNLVVPPGRELVLKLRVCAGVHKSGSRTAPWKDTSSMS